MKTFLSMVVVAVVESCAVGGVLPEQAPPVDAQQVAYLDDTIPKPMPKRYETRSVVTGYRQQCVNGVCSLVPVVSTETVEVESTSDPVASKAKPAQAPPVASSQECAAGGRKYLFPRLHKAAEALADRPKLFDGRFLKWFRHGRSSTGCSCGG